MKKYFSIDAEFSGPFPENHSILSVGACVIGKSEDTFYVELKPVSFKFNYYSMRIATQGLECIRKSKYRNVAMYNPDHRDFRPELVLRLLNKLGVEPELGIRNFTNWVAEKSNGLNPVMVAKPVSIDGAFLSRYFQKFLGNDGPFGALDGEGYLDLEKHYRKITKTHNSSLKNLDLTDMRNCDHNALEDALHQAMQFEKILTMSRF